MLVHSDKDVGGVRRWIDSIGFASSDERIQTSEVVTGVVVADERKFFRPRSAAQTSNTRSAPSITPERGSEHSRATAHFSRLEESGNSSPWPGR
jgi:hypothetical protein